MTDHFDLSYFTFRFEETVKEQTFKHFEARLPTRFWSLFKYFIDETWCC